MADLAELTIRVDALEVKRARQELDHLGRQARGTTRSILGMGAAFLGFRGLQGLVDTMADFEFTMAQVRGVAIRTTASLEDQEAQYRRLAEAARAAGASTKFSATEAAEAELFLARAGFDANQVIAALPATLNFATAATIDLGRAADIASNVLSTFSLRVTELGKVSDILIATTNKTNTDVLQLAEALKYAGPVAASFGQDLSTVTAAIGVLGDAGIQGSLAGTNVRGVLLALANLTPKGEAALKNLGAEMSRLNPLTNNFVDVMKELARVQAEVGKERFGAEIGQVFGRITVGGALVLTQATEKMQQLRDEQRAVGAESKRLSDIQSNTLRGSIKSLASAYGELELVLGDMTDGALKDMVDLSTDVVRQLAGMDEKLLTTADSVRTALAAVKGLGASLAVLLGFRAAAWFGRLGVSILSAATGMKIFNVAAKANPLGLVITAVGAAVALYEEYKDQIISVGDEQVAFGDLVGATWDAILAVTKTIWDAVAAYIGAQLQIIKVLWQSLVITITSLWSSLGKFLGVDWGKTWDDIVYIAKLATNSVIGLTFSIYQSFGVLFGRLKDFIVAFAEFDFSAPVESAQRVRQKLGEAIDAEGIIQDLGSVWKTNFERDFVGEVVDLVVKGGKQIRENFDAALNEGDPLARLLDIGNIASNAFNAGLSGRQAQRMSRDLETLQQGFDVLSEKAQRVVDVFKISNRVEKDNLALKELEAQATEALVVAQGDAARALEETAQRIQDNIALAKVSTESQFREAELIEIKRQLLIKYAGNQELANKELQSFIGLLDQLEKAQGFQKLREDAQRAEGALRDMLSRLREEQQLVGLTGDAREDAILQSEAMTLAQSAQTAQAQALADAIVREQKELRKLQQDARDAERTLSALFDDLFSQENLNRLADNVGNAFGDAFADIITQAKSLEDVLKNLAQSVIRLFVQQFVARPIAGAFSNIFGGLLGGLSRNADGNAFRGGRVIPFAKGGVVDGPTLFPMRGATGLMGEAGPEGILPLIRDAAGRLGVSAVGGGRQQMVDQRTYNIRMSLSGVNDPGSFRKAKRQISQDLRHIAGNI